MTEKYLIIGSNSFSGSNFINFILSKKKRVIGVSRSNEINKVYLPYKSNKYVRNFSFFKIDLNKDCLKLVKIIKKFKPNYIINFSAQGMVAESWKYPLDWYNTNLISQIRLHESIRKFKFIKKYIHFTTPEVYGSSKKILKENFQFDPSTPYASSRAACDLHLKTYIKAYKFPVIFTRTSNVFGPCQQIFRIVPKTIIFGKKNKKIPLHGGGNSYRSFIFIDDVSDAIYKILQKGKIGYTYHITKNKFISIRRLVKKIFKKMSYNIDMTTGSKERLGKDHSYKLSSQLIRTKIKWKPQVKLDDGIEKTINWVNKNFNTLKKHKTEYKHKK